MEYELPKKPKIKEKVIQPDQRKFCVVPLRAVTDKNLTLTGLKVLCLLASYCNKAGFTYVSQTRLANDLNISTPAINKQIKQLETKGYIKQFPGYHTMIKGKTKRIIYDEKITDREAEQIAGVPKEDITNKEIKQLYNQKYIKNNNDIAEGNKPVMVNQSTQNDNEVIASLFECVSKESELLALEKLIESGMNPSELKARLDQGVKLSDMLP